VNFGNQGVGTTSSAQVLTLTNSGTSPLTGVSVSMTGTNTADFGQTNNCGTSVAGNSSCTISVSFAPSAYGAESATLSVTDSAGTQTSSLSGAGINITAPTAQVTAPANGATVKGYVTVTATATDNVGVTSIQIYVDGTLKATGTTSPFSYTWDSTTVPNGSHTIYTKASDAAGNVGTSSTITVTVKNSSIQLIQNTGFETGNLTGWSATGAYLPFVTTVHPQVGTYSAQLGASSGAEPVSDSALYQTITIPSNSIKVILNVGYWQSTADTLGNDWQEIQIQNSAGVTLAQLMKVDKNTQVWMNMTYDISAYIGQTIRVYFNVHQNGNNKLTYMMVDDVSVWANY